LTTPPRRPSPSSRATRRSRRPAPRQATLLERYRRWLIGLGAVVIVVVLGGAIYLNSTTPAYACGNLFEPTPAPSWVPPTVAPGSTAAPATEPPSGYVQPDMGHTHVQTGSRVNYTYCPPASGKHYFASNQGPIGGGLYGPDEPALPQGWVHNLEHGAIVLLYKCPGPSCDAAGQAALADLLTRWPDSPICHIPRGVVTPVIARFDDMAWPYAALVWDVVLPMDTLDETAVFDFYASRGERFNQEKQCPDPTATPGPTPTGGPTPTAAPTAAPTPTAAPSAAPSAAPTTTPSAS
jgi:hypothetical protein